MPWNPYTRVKNSIFHALPFQKSHYLRKSIWWVEFHYSKPWDPSFKQRKRVYEYRYEPRVLANEHSRDVRASNVTLYHVILFCVQQFPCLLMSIVHDPVIKHRENDFLTESQLLIAGIQIPVPGIRVIPSGIPLLKTHKSGIPIPYCGIPSHSFNVPVPGIRLIPSGITLSKTHKSGIPIPNCGMPSHPNAKNEPNRCGILSKRWITFDPSKNPSFWIRKRGGHVRVGTVQLLQSECIFTSPSVPRQNSHTPSIPVPRFPIHLKWSWKSCTREEGKPRHFLCVPHTYMYIPPYSSTPHPPTQPYIQWKPRTRQFHAHKTFSGPK